MSAIALSPLGSVCAGCSRRLLRPSPRVLEGVQSSTPQQQTRYKSKIGKKATTIAVRLRQDLPEHGRKGSIVPLPFGQMRNYYYPQRIADYITTPEKLQLKRDGIVPERDSTFGRPVPDGQQVTRSLDAGPTTPRFDLKTVNPEDAFKLLSTVIPPTLDFYRTPIAETNVRRAPGEEAKTKAEEANQAAPLPEVSPRQTADNIYGSVSAADVNLAIKALLQNQGMQGLVVLPDEDVRFVNIADAGIEAPRLKKLGQYQYEVRIKGHDEPIRRTVRVLPEDSTVAAAS